MGGDRCRYISGAERETLRRLEEHLSERVSGQNHVIVDLSHSIRCSYAGLQDPNRPVSFFLFLGPIGVGKIELARGLAEVLFGSEDHLIHFKLSEYMDKRGVANLIDSAGSGRLSEAVRRCPASVVFFDEIDGAHDDLINLLLQIVDTGCLVDAHGQRVDFRNTILILSSDFGSQRLFEASSDPERTRKEIKKDALYRHFSFVLMKRLDGILIFNVPEGQHLGKDADCPSTGLI